MGAGFHGGFGKTLGTKKAAPINALGDVRYSRKKMEGYLLNLSHPTGSSKAKFMRDVLGYLQGDSRIFHKNIVSALIGKIPIKSEITPFGIKHTYHVILAGVDGKSTTANVVVVIQKDNGRKTYKIITVYPDKKGS